jgi:hypothetical protein
MFLFFVCAYVQDVLFDLQFVPYVKRLCCI